MKNNITSDSMILKDADPAPFISAIKNYLKNNLNDYVAASLANMLAIDYAGRLKKQPELAAYIQTCIDKIKNYLKHKVIVEEEFSVTMSLFVVAISQEKTASDELINEQEKNQDLMIEGLVAAHFGDLSPLEQKNIKEALRGILIGRDAKEIMNFIHSDPKLFYSVVFSAYKEKVQQKEINELVALNLSKIITENKLIKKQVGITKSLICKIALASGLALTASLGGFIGGIVLPLAFAPVVGMCIKIAPEIGTKLGGKISQNSGLIQRKQEKLKALIKTITFPGLDQSLEQSKYLGQKVMPVLEQGLEIELQKTPSPEIEAAKELTKKNVRQR